MLVTEGVKLNKNKLGGEKEKMSLIITGIGIIIVLVITNFAFQFLRNKDYEKAFERSYFQIVAILVFILIESGILQKIME